MKMLWNARNYQYAIVKYIGFHDRGMLLAGGCGDTNGAAGIKATDWFVKARAFSRTVYSDEEEGYENTMQ